MMHKVKRFVQKVALKTLKVTQAKPNQDETN